MAAIKSKDLTLGEVHRLLGWQRQYKSSFSPLLSLEPLTDYEKQELGQIRDDFDSYLADSKVLEGMVKVLTTFPLMRLAGFYRPPIKIVLEENIADIDITDEDTTITGRFDILSVNKTRAPNEPFFWVLLIESKNSAVDPSSGLTQLLTYAYKSLEHQASLWGLVTNGQHYQFVRIEAGNLTTYQLMPFLTLMEVESSIQILQVFKAICRL
jgi:hypothetical protein